MDVLIHVDFLLREVAYDIAIEDPILDELWFCQGHWMHRGEMVISPKHVSKVDKKRHFASGRTSVAHPFL